MPLCFVIMGFGKKKDPVSNRFIDLDSTYKKIIKPSVLSCGYDCVRADEILDCTVIDESMYALLYRADLVIADITTYNPNAIYELGIRHVFRPYTTIIIKEQDGGSLPFDINHIRTIAYSHLGDEISEIEAKNEKERLKKVIKAVKDQDRTDSPLYKCFEGIESPKLPEEKIQQIIENLKTSEDSIYSLTLKAKKCLLNEEFEDAASIWNKLAEKVSDDIYYVQQEALAKSRLGDDKSLFEALKIISKIDDHKDAETQGIFGSICKRLWRNTSNIVYLNEAMNAYKLCWSTVKDYYNGENYANCLELLSLAEKENNRKITYQVLASDTRRELIKILENSIKNVEAEDLMWKYATLANCYLSIGNKEKNLCYENKFLDKKPEKWQMQTYFETKKDIENYLKKKDNFTITKK